MGDMGWASGVGGGPCGVGGWAGGVGDACGVGGAGACGVGAQIVQDRFPQRQLVPPLPRLRQV